MKKYLVLIFSLLIFSLYLVASEFQIIICNVWNWLSTDYSIIQVSYLTNFEQIRKWIDISVSLWSWSLSLLLFLKSGHKTSWKIIFSVLMSYTVQTRSWLILKFNCFVSAFSTIKKSFDKRFKQTKQWVIWSIFGELFDIALIYYYQGTKSLQE